MIRTPLAISFALVALAIAASLAVFDGCQPTCDSIPTESLAQVRILNAVSNSPLLLVYVDGQLFDSAWFDVATKYYDANHNHTFGYRSTFLSNGFPLRAGAHHVVAIDANTRDSVVKWDGILYDHAQSLIYIGKINGSTAQTPRLLYLDDALRSPAGPSFARFVHAVPDIQGSNAAGLDVYFSSTPTATPDIRIGFGHISHAPHGDNGTGLSPDDYIQFPPSVPGLLIMPIGDIDTNDEIVSFPHALPTNGFLATIVIRGETSPVGNEPSASTIVLNDQWPGNFAYEIKSIGVRLVNATRFDSLSLLISNPTDQDPTVQRTTTNTPYPTQEKVTLIPPDSVSDYMGLGTEAPYYNFWFGSKPDQAYDLFHFTTNQQDTVTPVIIPPLLTNMRYSFVAIDTIPNDPANTGIGLLELFDTVSSPSDPGMGRIRFVNTTADYVANFTFEGRPFNMAQRDVAYADAPAGNYTFQVNGSSTIHFTVQSSRPTTIFFMPPVAGNPVPYRISTQ